MSDSMDLSMSCPICLETMSPPITQCEKGHSVCGSCLHSNNIKHCPLCRSPMTPTRNFQLEDVIEKLKNVTLKAPCTFASRGCKYELRLDEKDSHELECKSRIYKCEGKIFNGWNCTWTGVYVEILQHFKTTHDMHCWMKFNTEFNMKINFDSNVTDIQAIDFLDGQQLIWYKHKTDIEKEKAYWVFQYVGLKKQAAHYYYEFEIYSGDTRKMKITELCQSDCKDAHVIFNSEKCVVLSFKTIRNYLNEKGELPIRFRVMKIKKERSNSVSGTQHKNSVPVAPKVSTPYSPGDSPQPVINVPIRGPYYFPHYPVTHPPIHPQPFLKPIVPKQKKAAKK